MGTRESDLLRRLRELLDHSPSLSATDRRVLESLLLEGRPLTARELSGRTSANLQALYGALDRLEARGFVLRDRSASTMRFRTAHPSVILDELRGPWRRVDELAGGIEGPLRELHESSGRPDRVPYPVSAQETDSGTAASSWLVDRLRSADSEVWFFGDESPWLTASRRIESEIVSQKSRGSPIQVRLLVRPPDGDRARAREHERLRRVGLEVRYSPHYLAPAVVVDRRSMFVRSEADGRDSPTFLRLESAALCSDWVTHAESEWNRSAGAPGPPRR